MAEIRETAEVFGRNQNLLGIISEPTTGPRPGPSIVVLNAGIIHRIGPSRVGVEISRALSAGGYRVLRFDLSGIGDSAPSPDIASLADVVRGDIADAVNLMTSSDDRSGVILFGICSGADNAFYVGAEDERVVGLALIDPTVHSTPKFRVRRAWSKVTNVRSWWNVLSGRSLYLRYLRAHRRWVGDMARPPGYYGLLTLEQHRAAEHARTMSSRGVRFLYVITGDLLRLCNYPGQISDSLGGGIAERQLDVEWRPEADHLLRRQVDRQWLGETMLAWLGRIGVPAAARDGAA